MQSKTQEKEYENFSYELVDKNLKQVQGPNKRHELGFVEDTETDEEYAEAETTHEDVGEQTNNQIQTRSKPTLRRSERMWKPVIRPGYVSYLIKEKISEILNTYEEAILSSGRQKWMRAMRDEVASLERTNTWEEVERSPGEKILSAK